MESMEHHPEFSDREHGILCVKAKLGQLLSNSTYFSSITYIYVCMYLYT